MKSGQIIVMLLVMCGTCFQVSAQSAEKSSGVVSLNMKKKSTRYSEGSVQMTIPMVQKTAVELTGEVNGFTWITPTFTSVKTSESDYEIKATVDSDENIRFVNLFNNGQFIKNIIPQIQYEDIQTSG